MKIKSGYIELNKIPKEKIVEKNGKKFLNITVIEFDQENNYGQIATIVVSQSKEERDSKSPSVYIGNLKDIKKAEGSGVATSSPESDGLPF